MYQVFAAGAAALLIGGSVFAYGVSFSTEAQSTPVIAKGDRLDVKTAVAKCTQQVWPYYDASCLRNTASATRDVAAVRIVGQ